MCVFRIIKCKDNALCRDGSTRKLAEASCHLPRSCLIFRSHTLLDNSRWERGGVCPPPLVSLLCHSCILQRQRWRRWLPPFPKLSFLEGARVKGHLPLLLLSLPLLVKWLSRKDAGFGEVPPPQNPPHSTTLQEVVAAEEVKKEEENDAVHGGCWHCVLVQRGLYWCMGGAGVSAAAHTGRGVDGRIGCCLG